VNHLDISTDTDDHYIEITISYLLNDL